jgi:iron complex outermembrane recepter protein
MKSTRSTYNVAVLAVVTVAMFAQVFAWESSAEGQTSQTTTAPASSDTSVPKQDSGAELQEIVVTSSLLESLKNAQFIKQNSKMIVDSIVSEDIGKLPDNSVADALQRVTGVQVAPGLQGETNSVQIRGLPNVETTLDGMELNSALGYDPNSSGFNSAGGGGGRGFNFADLPATAVKAVNVYKTSDATLPTGGIAGTVDIQLYKPFDFPGAQIAGTYTETYSVNAGHVDPSGSLLMSDRWHTDAGDFGALINFGESQQHYSYNGVNSVNDPIVLTNAAGDPLRTPGGDLISGPPNTTAVYSQGKRTRPELNYALQWAPNDQLEVYAKGVFSWDHDDYNQAYYLVQPGQDSVTPSTYKATNNCYPNQAAGPFQGQTICDLQSATWTGDYYGITSTQGHQERSHDIQNSVGAKWNQGDLKLSTDFAHTTTSYFGSRFIVDTFLKGPLTDTLNIQNGIAGWSLAGAPQTNPANFYLNGLFQDWLDQEGKENSWRGDGSYALHAGPLSTLQFGAAFTDQTAIYTGSVQVSTPPPGGNGITEPGDNTSTPNPANQVIARFPGFFCGLPGTAAQPSNIETGCYNYLLANQDAIRAVYGLPAGLAPENPGRYYNIEEKRYAGYVQLGYDTSLLTLPVDGLLGVRVEKLNRSLDGNSFDTTTLTYSAEDLAASGTNALPNFSSRVHFTDTLQGRLALSKTVSYPTFAQLNPSLSFNPATINRRGEASGGNPDLPPMKSSNADLSLEWYFSNVGSLTGGLFYHKITGYIESYTTLEQVGGQPYFITSPEASGKGHQEGVELAYQQQFNFLPGIFSGFGTQFNYTYIDASTDSPAYLGGPLQTLPVQNVSKNNANAVLFYEKYNISTRLAYGYRGRYVSNFGNLSPGGSLYETVPADSLDLSVAYTFARNLTVVFTATNLTGSNQHDYYGSGDTRPMDVYYADKTYGLGFRFKLF